MIKEINEKINNNKEKLFDIFAIVLIIIFSVSISPRTLQNDTFYTVTIGELITKNGVDMQDHFSWHEDLPYTYPHWLYDVGMYYIYSLGGWTGIYISTCVLAAILGILIYKVNSKLSKNQIISFLITIGSMYLLKGYIAARAQLATFILFILLVYNIEKFIENKKVKNAVALLLIQTLIANLHVATWPFTFVLYLPYIAEYLICELIDISVYHKIKIFNLKHKIKSLNIKQQKNENEKIKEKLILKNKELENLEQRVEKIKEKRTEDLEQSYKLNLVKNKNVRWLILVMIIALFTGFLTPLGTTPYTYTYLTMEGNTLENINEHLPMTLVNNVPILCTIIIFLILLIFTKVKIRLSDLFMIGGIGYLMLATRRQSSMFALIGTIVLTRMCTNLISMYIDYPIEQLVKKCFNKFTAFVGIVLILIISLNNFKKIKDDPYVDDISYPVEAAEWILENLDIDNIKLYNEYNYGSYLLYKGIPVFIDSRADLYTPEFNSGVSSKYIGVGRDIFSDFLNCNNLGTYYGDIFKKYGITHIIVNKSSKISMLIDEADFEKYNKLYSDKNFVIYEILEY